MPSPKGKGRINVIYLKDADAEKLAKAPKEITPEGKKVKRMPRGPPGSEYRDDKSLA